MSLRYCLIKHDELVKMVVHADKIIDEGWKPQGGVALAVSPAGNLIYVQAFVREPLLESTVEHA